MPPQINQELPTTSFPNSLSTISSKSGKAVQKQSAKTRKSLKSSHKNSSTRHPARVYVLPRVTGRQKAIALKTRELPRKKTWKPGTVALREIRRQQKSTELCIRKLPFARLVREIIHQVSAMNQEFRVQAYALQALQEAAEAFLITEFEMSVLVMIHSKRVTLLAKDMQLIQKVRRRMLGDPMTVLC